MARSQKLLASGLIVFLLLAGSLPTLTRNESWPFLAYPMYSRVMRMGHFQTVRAYGIPTASDRKRFYLSEPEYTHPFSLQRLTPALGHLMRRSREDSVEAIWFVRDNYAARRLAGLHSGPELRGIALYGFEWEMDPLGRNADTPDKTTLLLELYDHERVESP